MRPNRMLPAARPADVAAVQYQRHQAEHFGAVYRYALERGVPEHQAVEFFQQDQRAHRVLAYIRTHPAVGWEDADKIVAEQDRRAAVAPPRAASPVQYDHADGPTMLVEPVYLFRDGSSYGH